MHVYAYIRVLGLGLGFVRNRTWNTLGADTRQAKAEESVAPNIPAVMSGAKADTMLIDCKNKDSVYPLLSFCTTGSQEIAVHKVTASRRITDSGALEEEITHRAVRWHSFLHGDMATGATC